MPGQKRKRRYKKRNDHELADMLSPRMKRLEDLTRLTFLITLDVNICSLLVAQVFPECVDRVDDAWIIKLATDRIRQNCRTWKSKLVGDIRVSFAI